MTSSRSFFVILLSLGTLSNRRAVQWIRIVAMATTARPKERGAEFLRRQLRFLEVLSQSHYSAGREMHEQVSPFTRFHTAVKTV